MQAVNGRGPGLGGEMGIKKPDNEELVALGRAREPSFAWPQAAAFAGLYHCTG